MTEKLTCPTCKRSNFASQRGLDQHRRRAHKEVRRDEAPRGDLAVSLLLAATNALEKDYDKSSSPADAIAAIQDVRKRLALVESLATTRLGQAEGRSSGHLTDGRMYDLVRGKDRTEWDHDAWKRDVRARVASAIAGRYLDPDSASDGESATGAVLVDTETGAEVTLERVVQESLLAVQQVHASAAPKLKPLRDLELRPGDYCTEKPGAWSLRAVAPSNPTTTQES